MTAFGEPPDPGMIRAADEVTASLRLLRAWAGNPSYAAIARKVNAAWRAAGLPAREWSTAKNTVADCFRARPRPNDELLIAIVTALHPEPGYVAGWRQSLRIVRGQLTAASFVSAMNRLPDELPSFVGRATELSALSTTAVTTAIEGAPGMGKTALAIQAGHRLLREGRFDQALYVDLRGFHPDPRQPPADPAAVLAEFLRLLGAPADQQQASNLEPLVTAYRTHLRRLRVLVMLDDAANEAQITPLIPEGSMSLALITSRHALTVLAGAERLALDALTTTDAVHLLRTAAGEPRYATDPAAAEQIAGLLGCLPLALAVVASRVRSIPWPLAEHLSWLAGRFDTGHGQAEPGHATDDRVSRAARLRLTDRVQLAIALSYEALEPGDQRLFRRLAWHPGPDLDPYAAAALADCRPAQATRQLGHLLAANLLQQREPGRYVLHDVIRAYAFGRAYDEEAGTERRAAITRLFDHYRHNAAVAMELCAPYEKDRRAQPTVPPASAVPLSDAAAAKAWLDTEAPNLLACAGYAAESGWPAHTVDLSLILYPYLQERSRFTESRTLHTAALPAARSRADRSSECQILVNLGLADCWQSRYPEALERFWEGLAIARASNDRIGAGRALANLGETYGILGRHQEALDYFTQALAAARETGYRAGEGRILSSIGTTHGRQGHYAVAIRHLRQALQIARELGDQDSESRALTNLGYALTKLGRYRAAIAYQQQAIEIFTAVADRNGLGYTFSFLGMNYQLMGQYREALDFHQRAWEIAHEVGNLMLEASAHAGLGDAHHDLGQPGLARIHWEQALATYAELGVPEAAQIRAKLDGQTGARPPSPSTTASGLPS